MIFCAFVTQTSELNYYMSPNLAIRQIDFIRNKSISTEVVRLEIFISIKL